jgi:hypothetical protein
MLIERLQRTGLVAILRGVGSRIASPPQQPLSGDPRSRAAHELASANLPCPGSKQLARGALALSSRRARGEGPALAQSGSLARFSPAAASAVRISVRDPQKQSEKADRARASGLWGVATSLVRRSGESDEPATG